MMWKVLRFIISRENVRSLLNAWPHVQAKIKLITWYSIRMAWVFVDFMNLYDVYSMLNVVIAIEEHT